MLYPKHRNSQEPWNDYYRFRLVPCMILKQQVLSRQQLLSHSLTKIICGLGVSNTSDNTLAFNVIPVIFPDTIILFSQQVVDFNTFCWTFSPVDLC